MCVKLRYSHPVLAPKGRIYLPPPPPRHSCRCPLPSCYCNSFCPGTGGFEHSVRYYPVSKSRKNFSVSKTNKTRHHTELGDKPNAWVLGHFQFILLFILLCPVGIGCECPVKNLPKFFLIFVLIFPFFKSFVSFVCDESITSTLFGHQQSRLTPAM